jgi:hypothetical protein
MSAKDVSSNPPAFVCRVLCDSTVDVVLMSDCIGDSKLREIQMGPHFIACAQRKRSWRMSGQDERRG